VKLHYLLIGMACLGLQASSATEPAPPPAPRCFDTVKLFATLKDKYKESTIVAGISSDEDKSTMTLWVNPDSGAWTIVATSKEISCIIGTGTDLTAAPTISPASVRSRKSKSV
jgi:hypothetical protein